MYKGILPFKLICLTLICSIYMQTTSSLPLGSTNTYDFSAIVIQDYSAELTSDQSTVSATSNSSSANIVTSRLSGIEPLFFTTITTSSYYSYRPPSALASPTPTLSSTSISSATTTGMSYYYTDSTEILSVTYPSNIMSTTPTQSIVINKATLMNPTTTAAMDSSTGTKGSMVVAPAPTDEAQNIKVQNSGGAKRFDYENHTGNVGLILGYSSLIFFFFVAV